MGKAKTVSKGPEYVCEICGFKTSSLKGFKGHMRLAHAKPVINEIRALEVQKALSLAREELKKIIDERIEARLRAYTEELIKVLKVLKENDENIIEGIKKRDKVLEDLWEAHERLHRIINKLCEKIGLSPCGLMSGIDVIGHEYKLECKYKHEKQSETLEEDEVI